MTRKDYERAAQYLGAAYMHAAGWLSKDVRRNAMQSVRVAIDGAAEMFAKDNPRFDRARFLRACGVTP